MPLTGIIILCHGSRGKKVLNELPLKMQRLIDSVKALLPVKTDVTWAALQFNHPFLEEAVASLLDREVTSVLVVPYFLFPGRHIDTDIPEIIGTLCRRYPDVEFTITKAIGDGNLFISPIMNRIRENAPRLWPALPLSAMSPETIERESMEVIQKLLQPEVAFSNEEIDIIKRIIHASGDPQIVESIQMSNGAAWCGIDAIKKGRSIITDVRMVAAGINTHMADSFNCQVLCALDELGNEDSSIGQITRSAAAMRSLKEKLNDAIIAIGNAPTSLLTLLDLIEKDNIKPALVIGMPVGFVQAVESKQALIECKVPFITIAGTRGGSAVAVATVNALLKSASKKN